MVPDLDRHLRLQQVRRYALQCALAGLSVLFLLLILDAVTQTVLIAALGSSAFIAFAVPRSLNAAPRNLVGGYLVGIVAGTLMSGIDAGLDVTHPTFAHSLVIICGAASISLAMFTMVVFRCEHPPAAALALGLVLNEWDAVTLVVIMTGIVALSVIKRVVMPLLTDLV